MVVGRVVGRVVGIVVKSAHSADAEPGSQNQDSDKMLVIHLPTVCCLRAEGAKTDGCIDSDQSAAHEGAARIGANK